MINVIYVHGWRESHSEANEYAATLQRVLLACGTQARVTAFTWSARCDYWTAKDRAITAGRQLSHLLTPGSWVVAHSLGARVIRESMRWLGDDHIAGLSLVAPDVRADVTGWPAGSARQICVYHADNDHALDLSQWVNFSRGRVDRLGEAGPTGAVPDHMAAVDCASIARAYGPFGHSYHGLLEDGQPGLVIQHLAAFIRGLNPPLDLNEWREKITYGVSA